MLIKKIVILSAALIVGSASVALANPDRNPESRIDHKYPWLEQVVQPAVSVEARGSFASGARRPKPISTQEKRWFDEATRPGY